MKIILSRKGFDSSAGGVASPIFPDGRIISLPIPDALSGTRYRQLRGHRPSIAGLINDLTGGRLSGEEGVHLDPDLSAVQRRRPAQWQPAFGQAGSALGHLQAQGVGWGDVFLFFGWFRRVHKLNGRWCYVSQAPDLHVLYGWLAVGAVWRQGEPVPRSLASHIHTQRPFRGANAIYLAAPQWRFRERRFAGAGVWSRYGESRVLTVGPTRSEWLLPAWFHPGGRESVLSYHQDLNRWAQTEQGCRLRAAARGQEFVLDADHYPEALPWLAGLLSG